MQQCNFASEPTPVPPSPLLLPTLLSHGLVESRDLGFALTPNRLFALVHIMTSTAKTYVLVAIRRYLFFAMDSNNTVYSLVKYIELLDNLQCIKENI